MSLNWPTAGNIEAKRKRALVHVVYLEPVPPEVDAIIGSCLPDGFTLCVRQVNESPVDVVGDADGVVVMPQKQAELALERLGAIHSKEAAIRTEIKAGEVIPSNMARLLREKGL